jgi:hypothetical protein
MASLESIIQWITSMFYWLIIASNPQKKFSSYFFQVTERTLHLSGKKPMTSVLNSKRKTWDAWRCGSLYKWFPRKFAVCKRNCELEQWRCPSVADVSRQTQSRYSALSVGRDNSRRNWKVHPSEKDARRYMEQLSQRNGNKLAQVVAFPLPSGWCPSQVQAEDYVEIFHSKSSKQIPKWYIKICYDCFLSRPLYLLFTVI